MNITILSSSFIMAIVLMSLIISAVINNQGVKWFFGLLSIILTMLYCTASVLVKMNQQ